jgi:hypothetical protein
LGGKALVVALFGGGLLVSGRVMDDDLDWSQEVFKVADKLISGEIHSRVFIKKGNLRVGRSSN